MADKIKVTRKDKRGEERKRQEKCSYNQWSEDRNNVSVQMRNQ